MTRQHRLRGPTFKKERRLIDKLFCSRRGRGAIEPGAAPIDAGRSGALRRRGRAAEPASAGLAARERTWAIARASPDNAEAGKARELGTLVISAAGIGQA